MTLAHARALTGVDHVHVEALDEDDERRALDALASWAMRFSPIVAPDPPDGLLLDITGCERLFHGEARLVNAIANSLEWLGFSARITSAATFGAAWGMARFGARERSVIDTGDERMALAPLPVEALRMERETASALREVGVERLEQLLELPRLELGARFGPGLLLRIDQVLGEAFEAIEPMRVREEPCVERTFDGPVRDPEAVRLTSHWLVEEIVRRLEHLEQGASTLRLECDRADASPLHETIELSRPSRSARHLWALLAPRVERLHLGFGIERMTLRAVRSATLPHEQISARDACDARHAWDASDEAEANGNVTRAVSELVDTLSGRLGADRAEEAHAVESHLPERAFRRQPFVVRGERPHDRHDRESRDDRDRHGTHAGEASVTDRERPSLLLERPEPADVMALTPDGPPVWLRWRGVARTIVRSFGPERIDLEWWNEKPDRAAGREPPSRSARDYFRIADESGRWLWIYRELETSRWFVHGEWA